MEDIQREVEVLNLISDHPNVAELVDSYEDPQHVHLVWLCTHTSTAGPIAALMAVHIMCVCKCARRVVTTIVCLLCQSLGYPNAVPKP